MLSRYKSLSGRVKAILILGLITVVLLWVSVAYAAWSQMKAAQTTAIVLGTFSVDSLECEDAIIGEWADCTAPVTNRYNEPISLDSAMLILDYPDASAYGEVAVAGAPIGGQQILVPAGATVLLETQWRPEASAAEGTVVGLSLEVVASAP